MRRLFLIATSALTVTGFASAGTSITKQLPIQRSCTMCGNTFNLIFPAGTSERTITNYELDLYNYYCPGSTCVCN